MWWMEFQENLGAIKERATPFNVKVEGVMYAIWL